jgi:Protein of unknown function (DUF995)
MNMKTYLAILSLVILTGCTNMNIFRDNERSAANEPPADLSAEPMPSATGMSAAQIKQVLSGKSWKWNSPKNSGVTLYADDGSSLIEVTGKGTTTGKWTVKDGQLCESFSASSFMKAVPMTCQPFSGAGNTYQVGPATFTLA